MNAPAPSSRPKLIYFAERPAHVERAAFIDRWRCHARLGMSQARWERNIFRYVHCDVFEPSESVLPRHVCDGVAMIWYRDDAARLRHAADPTAVPVMKADEAETFARPVREVSLLAESFEIVPAKPAPLKLFVRVTRAPGVDRHAFRTWWLDRFAPVLTRRLSANGGAGYVQNHARDDAPGAAVCDCVDEIGCETVEAAEAAYVAALDDLGDARRNLLDTKATWTVETLLFAR